MSRMSIEDILAAVQNGTMTEDEANDQVVAFQEHKPRRRPRPRRTNHDSSKVRRGFWDWIRGGQS